MATKVTPTDKSQNSNKFFDVGAIAIVVIVASWSGRSNMGSIMNRTYGAPVVMGDESIMKKKAHGTTENPPMKPLRWDVNYETADNICCYNRHFAEHSGYFARIAPYLKDLKSEDKIEYYDSVSGKVLFTAPVGRTMAQFLQESQKHGWPSFRDDEVAWENVRVLPNGETVSVDGTHLGHNLPDSKGNRYCINLVCIAGERKM